MPEQQPQPESKASRIFTDCMMIAFILAATVGFVVTLFLGGAIGIVSVQWLIKSFIVFEGAQIARAFGFAFMCLICGGLFLWMAARIFLCVKNGTERYLAERRQHKE